MIGKFLDEEEKSPEMKSGTDDFQTEEKNAADVFSLPQTPENDFSDAENKAETAEFNENTEASEIQDLSESRDYTVAPSDALVPANSQTEIKTESLPAETTAETVRKTGLAWSAATVLGGSIVFMLIIGWFFDLVFGSKPWGVVGGILLGAVVGFIQFFRITSRIFNNDSNTSTGILGDKD